MIRWAQRGWVWRVVLILVSHGELAVIPEVWAGDYFGQPRTDKLELVVGIYNFAEAPHATLARAQERAAEIFGRVGINLRWVNCSVSGPARSEEIEKLRACQQVLDFRGVFLRIIPEQMATGLRVHDTALGVAIPPDVAVVLYQRTQDLAGHIGLEVHAVLGPIIAHELGHLLLGTDPHSANGIMGLELRPNDFRPADSRTTLTFAPRQAQILRARLRKRILLRTK